MQKLSLASPISLLYKKSLYIPIICSALVLSFPFHGKAYVYSLLCSTSWCCKWCTGQCTTCHHAFFSYLSPYFTGSLNQGILKKMYRMNTDHNKTCTHFCIILTFCVKILVFSPFQRWLKTSFNCIQNNVEKLPGNVGVCVGGKKYCWCQCELYPALFFYVFKLSQTSKSAVGYLYIHILKGCYKKLEFADYFNSYVGDLTGLQRRLPFLF